MSIPLKCIHSVLIHLALLNMLYIHPNILISDRHWLFISVRFNSLGWCSPEKSPAGSLHLSTDCSAGFLWNLADTKHSGYQ